MSLATLPAAILETVLIRLTTIFLTGAHGDTAAARQAASQMLEAYRPETEDEVRLAANIICFSFQGLEALAQAAAPDLPLTRVLRLRSGAVSLSREAVKAERRLGQLQKARQQPAAAQAEIRPEPVQPAPKIDNAVALIQDTARVSAVAKAKNLTWTQAYEQRQRDARLAANIKKAQARAALLPAQQPAVSHAI